jgi:hypothetical protein
MLIEHLFGKLYFQDMVSWGTQALLIAGFLNIGVYQNSFCFNSSLILACISEDMDFSSARITLLTTSGAFSLQH